MASFNQRHNPLRQVPLLALSGRCGKWGIEHLVTCPKSAAGKQQNKMKEAHEE